MSTTTVPASVTTTTDAEVPVVPAVIRGEVLTDDLVRFEGRGESLTFLSPDPRTFASRLPLKSPAMLRDLYDLSFDEILDFLDELGRRLNYDDNEHVQWAAELACRTSSLTRPLIMNGFRKLSAGFARDKVREQADQTVGLGHLNGWVETTLENGRRVRVRAFGARAVHIVPGNGAGSAALTIVKAAFTRSDCIIKTPSNNPTAAVAIARTMCEMAPDHPITKHLAVAYWRGGDEEIEERLYQPHNINKIIAWGGFASVKHVARYIQPGLELISLDPKFSASVIGPEALADEDAMRDAALRLAVDVGTGNQRPCSSSRAAYVITGGIADANDRLNRFGELVYEELVGLPTGLSTKPKMYDAELRSNVDAIRLQDDFYNVIGGEDGEGCVIVSQLSDRVDFSALLTDRTINIVPVDTVEDALGYFDAYTQTIGVHPESLKAELVDVAPFYGVQRFVSLGYSSNHAWSAPHDGLELDRRMCRWVTDEIAVPFPIAYAAERHDVNDERIVVPGNLEAVRADG